MEQHPDKTFIGRISRGFDFLGYAFSPEGLAVAAKTVARFAERVTRLYEQGADDLCIGAYARHWRRWVVSGLGSQREPCLSAGLTTGRGGKPLGVLICDRIFLLFSGSLETEVMNGPNVDAAHILDVVTGGGRCVEQ